MLAGRYHLDVRLAAGGMGEVWQARDRVLGRDVAVKLLRPELAADPRLVARFRREAVAAARLSHPNIVRVFDTVSDHGTEAVIMQLVRGRTLRQALDDDGRLPLTTVLRIGAAVADALESAHNAGVVHRDVKPGNVLLTADGRILLADFGLAKVLDGDDGLTIPRVMIGTAKYLAPEQVVGEPVDGRADLYALGVVLFECLTGRVPFIGDSDAATAQLRLERDAPPVRSVRPGVPRVVNDLVARLLARDPADRPASGALARDILVRAQATVHDEPLSPVIPDPTPPRGTGHPDDTPPAPLVHHHRPSHRGWVAATTAIVLLAGGLVGAGIALSRTDTGDRLLRGAGDDTSQPATTVTAVPTTVAAPSGPAEIVSTSEFDPPPGDGRENPKRLGALTDGDPTTTWATVCYDSPTFAPKSGLGILLGLSAPASGHTLVLESPTERWSMDVYAASGNAPPATLDAWGDPIATGDDLGAGTTQLRLGQTDGRFLLLYLTRASPSDRCAPRNQVELAEVEIRG